MSTAYTLTIREGPFGSALEVLRKLIDPSAAPLAQVLVRRRHDESDEEAVGMYLGTSISQLEVGSPFTLDADRGSPGGSSIRTLWLSCTSPELERVAYHPSTSNMSLGIGLYDGSPSRSASRVLKFLESFTWGHTIQFEPPLIIEAIQLDSPPLSGELLALSYNSRAYLDRLAPEVSSVPIERLSEAVRVDLAERVVSQLMCDLAPYLTAPRDPETKKLPIRQGIEQPTLWDTIEPPKPSWVKRETWQRGTQDSVVGGVVTPPEVASDMVRAALAAHDEPDIHFGDPASGRGGFFAHLVAQVSESRVASAIAVELDPSHAALSERLWNYHGLTVVTGDFLDSEVEPQSRSLIVANPPYLRSQELDMSATESWREAIRRDLGLKLSGRCDLSVYVLLASDRWAKDGAIGAWLIPGEALQANYSIPLRRYLAERVELLQLHFFDKSRSLFRNARVSSVFILFRYHVPHSNSKLRITTGGTISHPSSERFLDQGSIAPTARWYASMSGAAESRDVGRIEISELFTTRRGIATGANDVFVVDEQMRQTLRIPSEWVKPVLPRARHLTDTVIQADREGLPKLNPRLWLIDTHADSDEVMARSPRLWEYLARAHQRVGGRNIVSSRRPFYRQEQRPPAPYLFGYMSRETAANFGQLPFYLNRSIAVHLNNYIGLYPKFSLLDARESGIHDVHVLELLRRIQTEELGRRGREYVGGLRKAEPLELGRFCFPHDDMLARRLLDAVHRKEENSETPA